MQILKIEIDCDSLIKHAKKCPPKFWLKDPKSTCKKVVVFKVNCLHIKLYKHTV